MIAPALLFTDIRLKIERSLVFEGKGIARRDKYIYLSVVEFNFLAI